MEAFIYDALRTVRGKGSAEKGALSVLTPEYLGSYLLKEFRKKNNLDTSLVEDVIMGCVTQSFDQGADIAKTIATTSGYGEHVAGYTVNRFCASGLEAINQAAAYVKSGFRTGAIIAGGVESMSRVKMGSDVGSARPTPQPPRPATSSPSSPSPAASTASEPLCAGRVAKRRLTRCENLTRTCGDVFVLFHI